YLCSVTQPIHVPPPQWLYAATGFVSKGRLFQQLMPAPSAATWPARRSSGRTRSAPTRRPARGPRRRHAWSASASDLLALPHLLHALQLEQAARQVIARLGSFPVLCGMGEKIAAATGRQREDRRIVESHEGAISGQHGDCPGHAWVNSNIYHISY